MRRKGEERGPGLIEPLLRAGHLVCTGPVHSLNETPPTSNIYGACRLYRATCRCFAGPRQPSETRTCVPAHERLKFTRTRQLLGTRVTVKMGVGGGPGQQTTCSRCCGCPVHPHSFTALHAPGHSLPHSCTQVSILEPSLFSSPGTPWWSDHAGPFQMSHDLEICKKKLGFSTSEMKVLLRELLISLLNS